MSTEPPPEGSEYIRWVQSSLNAVLGLRLPLDGVLGPETRSAIRSFQEKQGLPADGFVGPDTQNALLKARQAGTRPTRQELEVQWTGQAQEVGSNRRSPAYVRWVQGSLNRLLGLRLAVDGILGRQTRSAIRTFQQRAGLAADGVVGSRTEAALIRAGAGRPTGVGGTTTPIAAPDVTTLKSGIVRLANQEWQRWGRGRTKESNPRIRSVLEDYWRTGTGRRLQEPGWWSKHPWSAAFISWVMKKAGAGGAFRYSAAHAVYIKAAKDNRLAENDNPFKAWRITEVRPQVGDLVCKSRAGSGANYENIRPGHQTHCDIVVDVQPGHILTIGGNVSDSVSRREVRLDENGYLNAPGYFAVIRIHPSPGRVVEQEQFVGPIWDRVGRLWSDLTTSRIQDRTHLTPKSKRIKVRSLDKVYALVLHQMAFSRGSHPTKYDKVTAHYAILPDGQILQLHPDSAYLYSSNGFNSGSVAVEFVGNLPNTRGKCWKASKYGCHTLTQPQIDAGRYLIRHLIDKIGLTHVLAHRQSSGTRTNDPGPDIWYHVGQWGIDHHGLKDGGPGFKIGTGNPIPDAWRTWGKR